MTQHNYNPSSELQRDAEEMVNNQNRLIDYNRKLFERVFGKAPIVKVRNEK